MAWFEDFRTGRVNLPGRPPLADRPALPSKLLRHLLFSHGLGIGSRVLAAGCGNLVPFFDHLGIDAVRLDESTDPVANAHGRVPHVAVHAVHSGSVEGTAPTAGSRYDVVLAHRLRAYEDNLFSPAALRATADLLARVRPGGYLIFLARYGSDGNEKTPNHALGCYRQHLAAFPGSSSTRNFPDMLIRAVSWRQLLTRRPRSGFLTATVRLPEQTLPLSGLQHLADAAAQSAAGPCCLSAAESARPESKRRKAA